MKIKIKKSTKENALVTILCIVLFSLVFVGVRDTVRRSEKIRSTETIDLSEFGGRVYEAKKVHPGTFTLFIPFSDALKFGNDAILSYSDEVIQIWKPDSLVKDVFLHSAKYAVEDDRYYAKISYDFNSQEITIKKYNNVTGYMFLGLVEIVVTLILLLAGIIWIKSYF